MKKSTFLVLVCLALSSCASTYETKLPWNLGPVETKKPKNEIKSQLPYKTKLPWSL